jgi:hypothetical protein
MQTKVSLPQRFLRALPPIPEGAMALLMLAIVFGLGMLVGEMVIPRHFVPREPPTLQQQLDALDRRVQYLEHRQQP